MGRRKAKDTPVQSLLLVGNRDGQIFADHSFVRLTPDGRVLKELLGLRAAEERAAVGVIVEGFHAQRVPGTKELSIPPVPYHKRKIPDDPLRTLRAPTFVRPQD